MPNLVAFNPLAPKPTRWLKFLEELWPDDTESCILLQEWFGLTLVPVTSFQKALLLVGPAHSGKGIIADVLTSLHGGDMQVLRHSMLTLALPFGMQDMLDRTLAILTDLQPRGRRRNKEEQGDFEHAVDDMLEIVTEQRMEVDRKNLGIVKCRLRTRFMLLSTEAPRLSTPKAVREFRLGMVALELRNTLPPRTLLTVDSNEFTSELPGILLWAMEGWGRLRGRGRFEQPVCGLGLLQGVPSPSRAEASRAFHDQQEHRPPAGVGPDEDEMGEGQP